MAPLELLDSVELAGLVARQLLPIAIGQPADATSAVDVRVRYLGATQNSRTYVAESPQLEKSLFLKQTSPALVAEESRSLSVVDNNNKNPRFQVPKLIGCLDSHNIICTEFIDADNLSLVIGKMARSSSTKTAAMEEVGRWLANFHSLVATEPACLEVNSRLDFLQSFLTPVDDAVKGDRVIEACRNWLWSEADEVAKIPLAQGIYHGDCKSENFLLDGNNIVGLDFTAERRGPQVTDLAQFVTHLRLLCLRPSTLLVARHAERWGDAFVNAYRQQGGAVPMLVLRWMVLSHLLRLWAAERERNSKSAVAQAMLIRHQIYRLMA